MLFVPSLVPYRYLVPLPILGVVPSRRTVCCLSLLQPLSPHWPLFPMADQQQAFVCLHLCSRHSAPMGPQVQPDESIWEVAASLAEGPAVDFWIGAQS